MKLLKHIMGLTDSWPKCCWYNDPMYSNILWHAHRLGLVYRLSVTQVHWTDKGIGLYKKYLG